MPESLPIGHEQSILSMIWGSGPVVQSVLIILILLSVLTWAITFAKYVQLRRARLESGQFTDMFWESRNLERIDSSCHRLAGSPLTPMFASGYKEFLRLMDSKIRSSLDTDLRTIKRAIERSGFEEYLKLEGGTTFLATVASSAPFIGLFGTVWGIMTAFQGLGTAKSATIQAVAPGISEALVATAVGLAAAIPAAVAFNYVAASLKQFREMMDRFSADFLNLAARELEN